ncbi:MAG: valine--tRNA ligase [Candidatus Campbellbacteria bacterium]|nr:valine--tRNA ligase [Candidatus Campbellbacteria bacterium]
MIEKFSKPYDPQDTESKIYDKWLESGYFAPENLPGKRDETFTIIMPPPNANGSLHAGHAVFVTLEDTIIRYKRMRGYKALWLPGADHAGFETQIVYEKKLEKEKRSRLKMDPEDLREEIMEFTLANKSHMEGQLRQLGSSCDWSRETFTLDERIVKTVYDTFQKLYNDDLLYRGKRIVNWCTKHQTSLADLETESVEQKDPLYYMKYGPFTLATVRPETKFGDTAIAVHPADPRYKDWIGKEIEFEGLIGPVKLKVIADEFVDPEFGTGAVKVTPAHDPNDFAMAERHGLEVREVIDKYGKLNENTGKYAGMKIAEAREAIAKDLEEKGLLEKIEDNYSHTVKTCYKCGRIIEPRIMPQWFVQMQPLAEKAIEKIEEGAITFYPDRYKRILIDWLENIQDWNISRQIVWGIPIPAKICEKCGDGFPDLDDSIHKCPTCGGEVVKDEDTFDTWFSSGQWPFATLGYPNAEDYKTFYPTQLMETAADILFFWVSRMIMLGLYRTGELPFFEVYLHGLVTAPDGSKMSKSKGNVISPLEISDEFGTDALRMALVIGNTPGTNTPLDKNKVKAYKHFANKIWNATRFVLMNTEDFDLQKFDPETIDTEKGETHSSHLKRLEEITNEITDDLDNYRLHLAAEKTYHYFWHEFADEIIEESKPLLEDESTRSVTQYTLVKILNTTLKLLHPFMPFITEDVWLRIPDRIKSGREMLIVNEWPSNK